MAYKDYFRTREFKEQLRLYEEMDSTTQYAAFSSDDLTDIAEYYHTQGNMERALETIDTAISIYPGAVAPLVFRARTALMTDGDCSLANYYAEQIDDKNDLDYHYIHAEILIMEMKQDEANDYLTEKYDTVDEDEQQDYILDVATLFADYDLWDEAEAWASNYVDDGASDYMELQGRLMMVNGDFEGAEEIFNTLIDRDAFNIVYWDLLASTQFHQKKFEDSLASCDYALAINANETDALLTKANTLMWIGNTEEAVNCFKKYLILCGEEPQDNDTINLFKQLLDNE